MSWLSDLVRPRISKFTKKSSIPDDLWQQCQGCKQTIFLKNLKSDGFVCRHCDHHHFIPPSERLRGLYDKGIYTSIPYAPVSKDPLKFKDLKRYTDRLKIAQQKTGLSDAAQVTHGYMGGRPCVMTIFHFQFTKPNKASAK